MMPDVFDKLMCEVVHLHVYEAYIYVHMHPTVSEVMEGVCGVFFLHGFEIPQCDSCHAIHTVSENQAEECEQRGLFRCTAL